MGHSFTFRPGTGDEELFSAVTVWNEYRLPTSFDADDIILDIGSHIGCFSYAALERGCNHVHAFEAFSKNYDCMVRNLAPYGDRVRTVNKAVWRSDRKVERLTFTSFEDDNTAAGHVVGPQTGDGVEAVAFDDVVLDVTENGRKRIRMVKIDAEGSEFPILFTSRTLHLVDSLVGEYHCYGENYPYGPGEDHFFHRIPPHARVAGHDQFTHDELAVFLRRAGFDVTISPQPHLMTISGWFFANRVSRPSQVRDRIQWHWHGLKHKMARPRKAG